MCGATILFVMGGTFESYLWVFGLSSLGRALALILLARLPAVDVAADEVSIRTVAVRPNATAPDAPVLPSLPDQMPEPAAERDPEMLAEPVAAK